MEMVMSNGFAELSPNELEMVDGGELGALIVGGLISCVIYCVGNEVSKDFTGKSIGKNIADWLFPA